ncbi:hypothetical protein WJX84_003686 [Apatococcus fuscideae]|uniref:SnoaL-like domain-containing protein n=1 Tax=Apatococcus fuscideae TaxID=2026836 RepID=A0AAW1T7T6_9CHLO
MEMRSIAAEAPQLKRRVLLATPFLVAVAAAHQPVEAAARTAQDLIPQVQRDFQEGQYYITGRLTQDIFAPDCTFKDPTTNVKGPQAYSKAVAALFDPERSRADLISIKALGTDAIELKWRFEAVLKFPTSPKIKPYTGTTIYHISNGLIDQHVETWDISALDAFISVFVPSYGAPPAPPVTS